MCVIWKEEEKMWAIALFYASSPPSPYLGNGVSIPNPTAIPLTYRRRPSTIPNHTTIPPTYRCHAFTSSDTSPLFPIGSAINKYQTYNIRRIALDICKTLFLSAPTGLRFLTSLHIDAAATLLRRRINGIRLFYLFWPIKVLGF